MIQVPGVLLHVGNDHERVRDSCSTRDHYRECLSALVIQHRPQQPAYQHFFCIRCSCALASELGAVRAAVPLCRHHLQAYRIFTQKTLQDVSEAARSVGAPAVRVNGPVRPHLPKLTTPTVSDNGCDALLESLF